MHVSLKIRVCDRSSHPLSSLLSVIDAGISVGLFEIALLIGDPVWNGALSKELSISQLV